MISEIIAGMLGIITGTFLFVFAIPIIAGSIVLACLAISAPFFILAGISRMVRFAYCHFSQKKVY